MRQQHIDRGVSFLSSELCVMNAEDAAEHIFFVSARETLDQCDVANRSPGRVPRDGWKARVDEFYNFERKFEVKHTFIFVMSFADHPRSGMVYNFSAVCMYVCLYVCIYVCCLLYTSPSPRDS